jgi:hypothetical protein
MGDTGERGDIGECRVHELTGAIVGLAGGESTDDGGLPALLGGSLKFYEAMSLPLQRGNCGLA